jgi:two-component system, LytTR family, response regulator
VIRTAIVDDEPPARRKLKHLLARHTDFQVVCEAESGAEAVRVLEEHKPDLVFLDIQLPDCSGFDVVAALGNQPAFKVVFVTAFDEFALKAFDIHAADYLLKPVEPSRFEQCLDRLRLTLHTPQSSEIASRLDALLTTLQTEPAYARRLLIQEEERSFFLEVSRIDWIESARNYVCVHSADQTYILRSTLESVRTKLDPKRFLQINRSEIVNVDRISELRTWFHRDQKVILKTGTELNWSRRYRADSLEALERA